MINKLLIIFLATCSFMLIGCSNSSAKYDVKNEFEFDIPAGAKHVGIWLAKPQNVDGLTRAENFHVSATSSHKVVKDSEGNEYLYFELARPQAGKFNVTQTFQIVAKEYQAEVDPSKTRPYTSVDLKDKQQYLTSYNYAPVNDHYKKIASKVVGDETNPIKASRKIYDYVLGHVDYWVKDPKGKLMSSGKGSADYTYKKCTGNCTDFHAFYLSISRSAGIPTKITYGSMLKKPYEGLTGKDQSYHCWIDFYAPNIGWIPLDVALADVFDGAVELNEINHPRMIGTTADGYTVPDASKVDFYFGGLENRRIVWSVGRDLKLPGQKATATVDAMPKAYYEVDGKANPASYKRLLTFKNAN